MDGQADNGVEDETGIIYRLPFRGKTKKEGDSKLFHCFLSLVLKDKLTHVFLPSWYVHTRQKGGGQESKANFVYNYLKLMVGTSEF